MLERNHYLGFAEAALIGQAERVASLFQKAIVMCAFLAGLSGCSPLTVLNALTPQAAGTHSITSLPYGPQERQQLDVYVPVDAVKPAPVIVFFYGGEWRNGSRTDYAFVGHALAARGIVTVIADYRLYPEVRYPEFLVDSALAVAWVYKEIERYGGNPKQLFLMGHSAGAYNAAMVALDDRWLNMQGLSSDVIRGWIGLAGPYNFLPVENRNVQPVFFHPHTPLASQPIQHVKPGLPPALLIAAEDDNVVDPVRNTDALAEALNKHKVPVKTVFLDRVGHATLVATLSPWLSNLAPTLDLIERFVRDPGAVEFLPKITSR